MGQQLFDRLRRQFVEEGSPVVVGHLFDDGCRFRVGEAAEKLLPLRPFKKFEDLVDALKAELTSETTVLIKGSRFMRMERVADAVSAVPAESNSAVQPEGDK